MTVSKCWMASSQPVPGDPPVGDGPRRDLARHQRSISARRAARIFGIRTAWAGILTATTG